MVFLLFCHIKDTIYRSFGWTCSLRLCCCPVCWTAFANWSAMRAGSTECFTRSASSARLALLKRSIDPTRYPVIRLIRSNGTPCPMRDLRSLRLSAVDMIFHGFDSSLYLPNRHIPAGYLMPHSDVFTRVVTRHQSPARSAYENPSAFCGSFS